MKKITLLIISFIGSVCFAQSRSINNFELPSQTAFDFAFGGITAGIIANPNMTTPTGNGVTTPGPNTSARTLQIVTAATTGAFGGGYGAEYNTPNNLSTMKFVQCYIRSTANNFVSRIQFQDNPGTNGASLTQNPNEADFTYTGAGDWQLVQTQAAFAPMDFNSTPPRDLGQGNATYTRTTIFVDITNAITTAFTTQIDQITQSTTASPLLSAEDFKKAQVSIYPNPVNTPALNISGNIDAKTAYVYDMAGRQVLTKDITGAFNSVDVSELNTGIYFLRLDSGISLKFVKE